MLKFLIAMSTPDGILGKLLTLAPLALCACAETADPMTYGSRVDPTNIGVEASMKRDGSSHIYQWQVHDYDGSTHILTWRDSTCHGGEILKDFDSCLRNRCEPAVGLVCRPKVTAANHVEAPQIFSEMLACAASARMCGYQETLGPPATEYRVTILTGDAARYMAAGEISLSPNLGGTRIVVSHLEADKKAIVADVDSCLRLAAKRGLIESGSSAPYRYQTVEPLLDRFDVCLRSRSYSVEGCSERCPAPSTK
jgi:hypothetical protein